MKISILIFGLVFCVSCLRKKQNGDAAQIEAERGQPTHECSIEFTAQQNYQQIAETAQKIKSECNLTEEEMLTKARAVF